MRRLRSTLCLGLCVACSSAGETAPAPAPAAAPAPVVKTAERTVKATPDRVAKGEAHYQEKCAPCHGQDGLGRVGIAPSLASETFLAAASDPMLAETIRNGREGTAMSPWGLALGKHGTDEVIAYLRSKTPTEPAELDESPVNGDVERGGEVFASICSGCHGRSGAGYQEASSGTGIGRLAFLKTVSDGYLRYLVRHGKSGTKMRPFANKATTAVANLNAQQIEDVISYLRRNAW